MVDEGRKRTGRASKDERRWPVVEASAMAWIDTEQMIEVDRVMIEDLHIELIQMMENAGHHLARLTRDLVFPEAAAVYVGSGGNAGGGLVAARHLSNLGVEVTVVAGRHADELGPVQRHQLDIVERMGIAVVSDPVDADVAVDALIGYSLAGAPRGRTGELVAHLARSDQPVIALDVPSGLDTTTGATPGPVVNAVATLTLALPKRGLVDRTEVGRLFVADISVPPALYRSMGLTSPAPPFELGPILEVR